MRKIIALILFTVMTLSSLCLVSCSDEKDEFPFPVIFKPKDPQYFISKYKEAYNLSIIQPFGYKTRIRKLIYDVLNKIIEEHHNAVNNVNGGYTIRKSVDFIHKNYELKLPVAIQAKVL